MLLREIKNVFHKELDALYPKEEVHSFFALLIEHYLKLERFVLALQPDLIVSKESDTLLFSALSRLKLKEPIQHIIGVTHFMKMDFTVTKDVLIPRPETEELVQWIIDIVRNTKCEANDRDTLKILDIGTGSGCIAISLAKNLPKSNVHALDISEAAIAVAKKNAKINEVEISFLKKDILEPVISKEFEHKFDLVVSNPPYVRETEKKEMHKNVLDYEPDLALFVSDENPLLFYQRIIDFAIKNLRVGGLLFFEINQYLGKETEQLLKDANFSEIELRKDMFGNDRMLKGVLKCLQN